MIRPGTLVRLLDYYRGKHVLLRQVSFDAYRSMTDVDFDASLHSHTTFKHCQCALVVATSTDKDEGEDIFLMLSTGLGWCREDMLTTVNSKTHL